MNKILVFILTVLVSVSLFKISLAQDTEPPLGLPTIDEEETVTPTATYTYTSTATQTVTPTASTQEVIDDAEVGSEIVLLVILSVVGGLGIFLIKKYFDTRSYNL